MHGHRYRWEAELAGGIVTETGAADEGMLVDFGEVSSILQERIHDVVDHAFILHAEDEAGILALSAMGDDHRTVILPFVPTAENLARWAFEQVDPVIADSYGGRLSLVAFHVRETPKSWATWRP